ncbi:MAG: hypothetical protein Q7J98_08925 [Kiritimatiellia bacterium]|nr:hypothetical protein [Kiritimatiellia bacterium]
MIHGADGRSPVAPVDLAPSAIGPGMAVFSKYTAVLEADGKPMTVHTALTLINKAIDEYFTQAESDMDADIFWNPADIITGKTIITRQ